MDDLKSKTVNDLELAYSAALEPLPKAEAGLKLVLAIQNSEPARALTLLEEIKSLSQANGLRAQEAKANNALGNAYCLLGNYGPALRHLEEALQIHEEINDEFGSAMDKSNIAAVFEALGDFPKALDYFEEALHLLELLQHPDGISKLLGNIGIAYFRLNNFGASLDYFTRGLELAKAHNRTDGIAAITGNIGAIYIQLKDYDKAESFLKEALQAHQSLNSRRGIATIYNNLGNLYFSTQSYAESLKFYKNGLSLAEEIGAKSLQMNDHKGLGEVYEAQRKWKLSYLHMKARAKLDEDVRSDEAKRMAANRELKAELDLKEKEREVTTRILHNILPEKIAERIKRGEDKIMERYENASVMFADIVEFTSWSSQLSVQEVAGHLNNIFQMFDELANQFGVEKIKTIGDAYMCVAGLPEPAEDHAHRVAKMALAMNEKIKEAYPNGDIKLRIGIHSGEVIAGVIGKNKYAYDLWGDTVNTASRMESHGLPDKIQVTEEFKNLVSDRFKFEDRGEIAMKGKGKVRTWFLKSPAEN